MFFFWYPRGRHSKQKSNWSGQIIPILIIILAGLGVAYLFTIRTGEGAKAKTFASNAADACSLATASYQAGAFNKLVGRNGGAEVKENGTVSENFGQYMVKENKDHYYKRMKHFYQENYARYKFFYELGNYYLVGWTVNELKLEHSGSTQPSESAPGKPAAPEDNAKWWLTKTLEKLNWPDTGALAEISKAIDCSYTDSQSLGATKNREAEVPLLEAKKCVAAFFVCTEYMKKITDYFKNIQSSNFCEATGAMANAYTSSIKAGQQYGYNNSSLMSLLTPAQGDDFNLQMGTGVLTTGAPLSRYCWGSSSDPCACHLSVNVDLPSISTYQVRHTLWNYPQTHTLNSIAFSCGYEFKIDSQPFSNDPFNMESTWYLYYELENLISFLDFLAQVGNGTDGTGGVHGLALDLVTCCQGSCCHDNPDYCPTAPLVCCTDNSVWPPRTYCDTNSEICSDSDHCCDYATKLTALQTAQNDLITAENCVIQGLIAIRDNSVDSALNGSLSITGLQTCNNVIWTKIWNSSKVDPVAASTSTGSPPTYPPPPGWTGSHDACWQIDNYDDGVSADRTMNVIDIEAVTLSSDKWETTCTVTATCNGSTTTSTSTAKFDGGNIASDTGDTYYPEIIKIE